MLCWSMLLHGFGLYNSLQIVLLSNDYEILFDISTAAAVIQALSLLFYPIAGLLAETCCKRVKVMLTGNVLMVLGIVVYSPFLVVLNEIFSKSGEQSKGLLAAYIILLFLTFVMLQFGLAVFEANAIQFGTDQLQFSPSEELSKFVHWYYWSVIILSYLFGLLSVLQDPSNVQLEYVPYINLALLLVALVLVAICWHQKVITIEPLTRKNPLSLIIAVIKFAKKHKTPLFRSAFTYGEVPERLDMAKQRYGGPFTTEEVENVKSFWRILLTLLPLFGYQLINQRFVANIMYSSLPTMDNLFDNTTLNKYFASYYLLGNPQNGSIVPVLAIPIYELLFRSCTNKFRFSMLKRMGIGILTSLLTLTCAAAIKYLAKMEAEQAHVNCSDFIFDLYNFTEPSQIPLVVYLVPVSVILTGISHVLVFMTALEFILAQAPRSMQGLLIGFWYAYQSLGILAGAVSSLVFNTVGCDFVYLDIGNVGLCLACCVLYVVMSQRYKYRVREELTDTNQQSIIEDYTERQLSRRLHYTANQSFEYKHVSTNKKAK